MKTRTRKIVYAEGELNYADQCGDITRLADNKHNKLARLADGTYELTIRERRTTTWVPA